MNFFWNFGIIGFNFVEFFMPAIFINYFFLYFFWSILAVFLNSSVFYILKILLNSWVFIFDFFFNSGDFFNFQCWRFFICRVFSNLTISKSCWILNFGDFLIFVDCFYFKDFFELSELFRCLSLFNVGFSNIDFFFQFWFLLFWRLLKLLKFFSFCRFFLVLAFF